MEKHLLTLFSVQTPWMCEGDKGQVLRAPPMFLSKSVSEGMSTKGRYPDILKPIVTVIYTLSPQQLASCLGTTAKERTGHTSPHSALLTSSQLV